MKLKKITALALAALLLTACAPQSSVQQEDLEILAQIPLESGLECQTPAEIPVEELIYETSRVLLELMPDPQLGAASGDWTVLSLARANAEVPEDYYDTYYGNAKKAIKAMGGDLAKHVDTDSARTVMALTAIGRDPRHMAGYDLLEPMGDLDQMEQMGLYGSIFTLIALDTGKYEIPKVRRGRAQASRQDYIENILKAQEDHGGWHSGGYAAEPGVTSMALIALAPYREDPEVALAVDRGLDALEEIQLPTGGFCFFNGESSMDTAQVIAALAILGISPEDPRFRKGDTTLYDRFLEFRKPQGGFSYSLEGGVDLMATERALLALTAVYRLQNGLPDLVTMTDVL